MRRYIRIISVVFLCSTLGLGYFAYLLLERFGQAVKYTDVVNHTYEIINRVEQLESYAKDAETAQRGFVITKDSAYLAPLFNVQHKIYLLSDSVVRMVEDIHQKEKLIMLKANVAILMSYIDNNLQLEGSNNKVLFKKSMDDGKMLMDGIRGEVGQIKTTEFALLNARNNAKANYLKSTSTTFITILLCLASIMITTFVLLIQQLRKRYRFQLQLQHQIAQLRQFTKESEELSFAVSHDLQEPLRKMRIFTDRLFERQKNVLGNEERQILQRMNAVAASAQDTMNELLRFIAVIPQTDQTAVIDLNKLVKQAWGNLTGKANEKNAVIEIDNLPIIIGSAQRLAILFENLFMNALVYSKEGTAPVIKIRAFKITGQYLQQAALYQQKQGYDAIEISDNGIGFDNMYASKIFQLFRRLHIGQDKYAGKGIGLAICQRIISNHHGFIDAKGKQGEGAVFTVYFPFLQD